MKNLKDIRTRLGFSQQQLADAIHISRAHYCNIENCKRDPSIELAGELATFLGVTIDELRGSISVLNDDYLAKMNIIFKELNIEGKQMVIDYASMIASKPSFREKESAESAM